MLCSKCQTIIVRLNELECLRKIACILLEIMSVATSWSRYVPRDKHDDAKRSSGLSFAEVTLRNANVRQ